MLALVQRIFISLLLFGLASSAFALTPMPYMDVTGTWSVLSKNDKEARPFKGVLKLQQYSDQVTGKSTSGGTRWVGTVDQGKRLLRADFFHTDFHGKVYLKLMNDGQLQGTWVTNTGDRGTFKGTRYVY